jgi:hypothetical protein
MVNARYIHKRWQVPAHPNKHMHSNFLALYSWQGYLKMPVPKTLADARKKTAYTHTNTHTHTHTHTHTQSNAKGYGDLFQQG